MDLGHKKMYQSFFPGRLTFLKLCYLRVKILFTPKSREFKALHDKYKGQKLYLVALGPSLTIADLELLHDHKCISMSVNGIFRLFSRTSWRPDIYFCSDKDNISEFGKELFEISKDDVPYIIYNGIYMPKLREDAIPYCQDASSAVLLRSKSKYWKKKYRLGRFSTDASRIVYGENTCISSAMQIAFYMGFSTVYLLGADCCKYDNMVHAEGVDRKPLIVDDTEMQKYLKEYEAMDKEIKRKGLDFKIYNATRGGALEVFERISLEDTFDK